MLPNKPPRSGLETNNPSLHQSQGGSVVIDNTECVLDELRVRACSKQTDQLRSWAVPFPDRVWAIESARGLGYLLALQLVAAGEIVVDVPPVLSTRTRLLGSGKAQKNDRTTPAPSRSLRCARRPGPGGARRSRPSVEAVGETAS